MKGKMEEQTVVYSYKVLLLSNLKNKTKHTTAFFNNMDESQKHHTELKEVLHQRVHTFWGCDNFLFLDRDLSYKSELIKTHHRLHLGFLNFIM